MSIITWIILGLIAGAIAKAIMPGNQGGGIILTMVLGIVGALVGGFLGTAIFGIADLSGFDLRSIVIAVIGALIVLFLWGLFTRNRA
ncbi:MAG TPA: GlsB/YeaQ/YmgE family stress response membrane protein [Burkholderiales bacterium]|nr:GlsB/YeaQ/YmgE family stress response membrane protein [Burkholderiales bacterium]